MCVYFFLSRVSMLTWYVSRDYAADSGYQKAQSTFNNLWTFANQDCTKLASLVDTMESSTPAKPYCTALGWGDGMINAYNAQQGDCFADCKFTGMLYSFCITLCM